MGWTLFFIFALQLFRPGNDNLPFYEAAWDGTKTEAALGGEGGPQRPAATESTAWAAVDVPPRPLTRPGRSTASILNVGIKSDGATWLSCERSAASEHSFKCAQNVNFTSTAGDIHSTGSSINAGQDINLLAQGNVTLDSVSVYGVNKSSSFAFTGNGVGYNQDEANFAKTEQSELSAGNNINVTAGKNILGVGLIAQAGNTLTLTAGNDVTLEEHKVNLYDKQNGWTVSLDFPGSDLVHAAFTGGDLGQAAISTVPGGSALEQLINTRKAQDLEANGAR